MLYQAKKPVRFDKDYFIGDMIPGEVIMPGVAASLVAMGLIVETEETEAEESVQMPQEDVPDVGNVNTRGSVKDAAEGIIDGVATQQKAKKRGRPKEA